MGFRDVVSDWEDERDEQMRQTETKQQRRLRRKQEMQQLLKEESMYREEIVQKGVFVMSSRRVKKGLVELKEQELLQLAVKARQGRYPDEEIGRLFRQLFKDF